MAITVKEVREKLNDPTLSKEETQIFFEVEKYVDKEIERLYEEDRYGVPISSSVIEFNWLPSSDTHCNLKKVRKTLLKEKLLNLYKQNGWKIEQTIDKSLYVFFTTNS